MQRLKQTLIVVSMVITWGATFLIAMGSPGDKGKVCIFLSGVLINVALGLYYSFLKQRPRTFREWLTM